GQIAQDVPVRIAGHDDVEGARIRHQVHRGGVDVKVRRRDLRVLLSAGPLALLPKPTPGAYRIRFVHEAHLAARRLVGEIHDPGDPVPGVDVGVYSDLHARRSTQVAAHAAVESLGVLADDHTIDRTTRGVPKRA